MSKKRTPTKLTTYRDSIMKPGAARIALTGRCNPFLGGTAAEACLFINEAAARAEIRNLVDCPVIDQWEIQTLRADGLWLGCVASGAFEESAERLRSRETDAAYTAWRDRQAPLQQ